MFEGIAVAIAAAVRQWLGGGELAKVLSSAGGKKTQAHLESLLADRGQTKAMEVALAGAVNALGDNMTLTLSGREPDWSFLKGEASDELAKIFVVGEAPDPGLLAESWVNSWQSSGDPELSAKAVRIAMGSAPELVAQWSHRVEASPLFRNSTDPRLNQRQTVSLEALAEAAGVSPATRGDWLQYLYRVQDEHQYLDTAGTGQAGPHGSIALDDVFVSLSAVEDT